MIKDSTKKIPNGRWLHIIPPAMLVYIVAFMDRTNIGFAIAGGMDKELGMTATLSGIAAGIFFIGYLSLQVKGSQIAERGSAKKFIAWTIVAWGGLAVLSGFVQNTTQLLVIRFLLGVAEGGVWPAVLTILSHWFPNEERGRANAYFIMNVPIASIITGPLSGLIVGTYGWRQVFIIEGAIAFVLLAIWFPLISDRPSDAKWISKEEKDYIENKLREEQELLGNTKAEKVSFKEVIKNGYVWKLSIIYCCFCIGVYGYALWLPTIIKQLTKSSMLGVGLWSTIPYIGTIIGLLVFAKLADKTMNRRFFTASGLLVFAVCLALSVVTKNNVGLSFAFLIGCGVLFQAPSSTFWTILPLLFSSDEAASARGVVNGIGNLGGFIGPYLVGFLTVAFNQGIGLYTLAGFMVLGCILTLTLPGITAGEGLKSNSSINKIEA
jgi:sugar phosphate permease